MLKKINRLTMSYIYFSFICMYGSFFTSCRNESKFEYIISREDSIYKTSHTRPDGVVLLPPKVVFGRYNFIVDSTNNVYFYSFQEPKQISGFFDGELSEFACLQPNYLFKIPKGLESIFFEENVVLQKTSEKIKTINVASVNDTVKHDFIKFLRGVLHDDSSGYSLRIRRVLPEETEVLRYKLQGKHYSPNYKRKDCLY
ncbi:hypothetical protein QWY86_15550 [Pedobacter aquatilis]|uniref:hypothetical protein n=1 Tax=Pedobacter aquatilis TaxID=351343 RepID=UPI0025B52FFD|nr:hypothetical protein [Pedobacter aquatilis]MDN3588098.1 hypothetical protein [Pedobacter aquatilis]